jgi:hypothetical protein
VLLHNQTQHDHIQVNVRKQAQLYHDATGEWLELDIWIPQLHLAFEYQVSTCACHHTVKNAHFFVSDDVSMALFRIGTITKRPHMQIKQ